MTGIEKRAQDLIAGMQLFEGWEERFGVIIEMGEKMSQVQEKSDRTHVSGCESNIWIEYSKDDDGRIEFRGDADSVLVKGIVGMVLHLYSGERPSDIQAFDFGSFLKELGVEFSMRRSQGLQALQRRILEIADSVGAAS